MLRSALTRAPARWNSTCSRVIGALKAGEAVSATDVSNALAGRALTGGELKSLHEALQHPVPRDVTNAVLQHALAHDFSLYFTLAKHAPGHQWDSHAMQALVEHNPGRVFSVSELVRKHSAGPLSDAVRRVVVRKLLLGENNETEEFAPTASNVDAAISAINGFGAVADAEPSLELLYGALQAQAQLPALGRVTLDISRWLKAKLDAAAARDDFLPVAQLLFAKDPAALSHAQLSKALAYCGSGSGAEPSGEAAGAEAEFCAAVLAHVEQHRMDVDKRHAEALLLRIQLVETYGIHAGKLDLALQKFHHYQTHEKSGLELVQSKLVQALCYQAFKQASEALLQAAHALADPQRLAVPTVAQLILASSRFSSQRSLDLYNTYIAQVSGSVNAATGRSAAGVLTEALMVGSLYDGDREFAHLVYEKAIVGGVVTDEAELAAMKRVFKVYGDAFVEDSWAAAQPIFGEYVLRRLKSS